MRLSILCVTKAQPYAASFLVSLSSLAHILSCQCVFGADGDSALARLAAWQHRQLFPVEPKIVALRSAGYIESVLDEAVEGCDGDYILRLDDDETASAALIEWLVLEEYLKADHWKFPRMHLWPDARTMIRTPHLFPDYQTRLSTKRKSGGRYTVHAGSPYGGGFEAPAAILHHKFLVKSYEERLAIARVYDDFRAGYGTGSMLPFSLPEVAYQNIEICEIGNGRVPWTPLFTRTTNIARSV